MTEQTAKAIELTKELFTGKTFSEYEWNTLVRCGYPNFNPTLRTVLKYLEHEKIVILPEYDENDDACGCYITITLYRLK